MAQKMAVYGLQHQRGRLAGRVVRLEEVNRQHALRVERLQEKMAAHNVEIERLRQEIAALGTAADAGFGVQLPAPIPRRTIPKHHFAPWGAMTREILRQLRLAQGKPLATATLSSLIQEALQLALTSEQLPLFRDAVGKRLRYMRKHKQVCRGSYMEGSVEFSTWVLADFAG